MILATGIATCAARSRFGRRNGGSQSCVSNSEAIITPSVTKERLAVVDLLT